MPVARFIIRRVEVSIWMFYYYNCNYYGVLLVLLASGVAMENRSYLCAWHQAEASNPSRRVDLHGPWFGAVVALAITCPG